MNQPFLIPSSIADPEQCPLCEGEETVTDIYNGENTCTNCGCVLNDVTGIIERSRYGYTNHRSETYRPDTRSHGSGRRPSIYDFGLSTYINGNKDANGTTLSRETAVEMKRLQRQDNRTKVDASALRNLTVAMSELDRMVSALNLSIAVKEDAALIYRQALKKDLVRGRSIDAFVAASLYASCRVKKVPRPLKDVCETSKRTYKEVSMTYRLLLRELKIRAPIDNPIMYVPSLAASIGLNMSLERAAVDILKKAKKQRVLAGKDPRGVAAAALYLASKLAGEQIIQSTIAKAADTTEVTLRNRYRSLKKALNIV